MSKLFVIQTTMLAPLAPPPKQDFCRHWDEPKSMVGKPLAFVPQSSRWKVKPEKPRWLWTEVKEEGQQRKTN